MGLYDARIEKFSKKVEQLERNIKRDTEERRRLLSEIDTPKLTDCVTSRSAKS